MRTVNDAKNWPFGDLQRRQSTRNCRSDSSDMSRTGISSTCICQRRMTSDVKRGGGGETGAVINGASSLYAGGVHGTTKTRHYIIFNAAVLNS